MARNVNQTQSSGESQPLPYSEADLLGSAALCEFLQATGYRILETLSLANRALCRGILLMLSRIRQVYLEGSPSILFEKAMFEVEEELNGLGLHPIFPLTPC